MGILYVISHDADKRCLENWSVWGPGVTGWLRGIHYYSGAKSLWISRNAQRSTRKHTKMHGRLVMLWSSIKESVSLMMQSCGLYIRNGIVGITNTSLIAPVLPKPISLLFRFCSMFSYIMTIVSALQKKTQKWWNKMKMETFLLLLNKTLLA